MWALDQLAQRDPRAVRTLTNLGRRLAEAQGRAVRGGREAARLLSAVAPTFGFGQVADVPVADAMRSQATEVVTREKLSPEVISGKEVFEAAEQADRELFERRTEQRRAEDAVAAARAARREADRLRSSR